MTLTYKSLIVFLLTLISLTKAKSQTDHLEPAESYFSSWNFSDKYQSKCRKVLYQKLSQYFEIRIAVFPSFQKEYLLTIEKSNNKLALIYREPSSHIWSTSDTTNITVIDKKIIVDTFFCDTLKMVFEKLILETAYAKNTNQCGADGTEYQFIIFIKGKGQIIGRTWNCAEGKRMKALLDIVSFLQKICSENLSNSYRENILNKCKFLLAN